MPGPHFFGPVHLVTVLFIERPDLFFVQLAGLGEVIEHLPGRQFTAGVFGVAGFIETGILETPGKHLGTAHGLAGLVDLVLDHGITDHHAALDGFLPQQFAVDQGIQRGLAQLLVGFRVADAAYRPALIFQVFGEIALQAQLGNFLAIDPRRDRPIAAPRHRHPERQQDQQSVESHDRPPVRAWQRRVYRGRPDRNAGRADPP
ncbi:hypothetical protein D3C76_1177190 [compost metagenome]